MHAQQIQNEFRIRRVIFGPTGMKGFAILGHHGGIHGIEIKLVILHQEVEEAAGFLFDGDGDLLVRIALVEVLQPGMERLGRVGQFVMGAMVGGGLILPQVMRGISPINGNQQGVFRPRFRADRPWWRRGGRSPRGRHVSISVRIVFRALGWVDRTFAFITHILLSGRVS